MHRYSQTFKMKIVSACSSAIYHVIKTDRTVNLWVNFVLTFNDVIWSDNTRSWFYQFNLGPFSFASLKRMSWSCILHFRLMNISGVFCFRLFFCHWFGDIFAKKVTLTTPTAVLASNWDAIFAAAENNNKNSNNKRTTHDWAQDCANQVIAFGFTGVSINTRVPIFNGKLAVIGLNAASWGTFGLTESLSLLFSTIFNKTGRFLFILEFEIVLCAFGQRTWIHDKCGSWLVANFGGAYLVADSTVGRAEGWALFWALDFGYLLNGVVLCVCVYNIGYGVTFWCLESFWWVEIYDIWISIGWWNSLIVGKIILLLWGQTKDIREQKQIRNGENYSLHLGQRIDWLSFTC